jgi:hypothetical protein
MRIWMEEKSNSLPRAYNLLINFHGGLLADTSRTKGKDWK